MFVISTLILVTMLATIFVFVSARAEVQRQEWRRENRTTRSIVS